MLQEEQDALTEYDALADLKLDGRLSPAQEVRLREVEATLDRIEAEDPETKAGMARLREVVTRLDAILAEVRRQADATG